MVTHLWHIGVVEHAEDDRGEGVDSLVVVGGWDDLGQGVLECLGQDAVKRQVRPQNLLLHPLLTLHVAQLGPQTVQVLQQRGVTSGGVTSGGVTSEGESHQRGSHHGGDTSDGVTSRGTHQSYKGSHQSHGSCQFHGSYQWVISEFMGHVSYTESRMSH